MGGVGHRQGEGKNSPELQVCEGAGPTTPPHFPGLEQQQQEEDGEGLLTVLLPGMGGPSWDPPTRRDSPHSVVGSSHGFCANHQDLEG
jgi:hypothetical protein